MGLSSEEQDRIERLISKVRDRERTSRDEAFTMIHKYICEGSCGWYRRNSRKVGFDRLSLTAEQRNSIGEAISQIMNKLTLAEAKSKIHRYICHS